TVRPAHEVKTDSDADLELLVEADFNPEVDLWGARRRTKLFKRVFGTKLSVQWAGAGTNKLDDSQVAEANIAPGSTGAQLHQQETTPKSARQPPEQSPHPNGRKSRNGSPRKSGRKPREQSK